jgi:hypothetical protein
MTLSRQNKQRVIYNCPKSGTVAAGKTRLLFFNPKTYFQLFFLLQTLRKHQWNLVSLKNTKNYLKTHNQHENKKISKHHIFFLGVFKVRKHLILTLLVIWDHLTQKSIVLVVKIIANNNFLFFNWNPVTLSLSSTEKWLKK